MRRQVESALEMHNVQVVSVRTCQDVRDALSSWRPPEVILIGTSFAKGKWRDVVTMARARRPPVDVLLTIDEVRSFPVSEPDPLHLENMNPGAFDLLVIPSGANVAQTLARRFAGRRTFPPPVWRKAALNLFGPGLSVSARQLQPRQ